MTAIEGKTYQRTAHKTAHVVMVNTETGDVTYQDEGGDERCVTKRHFEAEFGNVADAPHVATKQTASGRRTISKEAIAIIRSLCDALEAVT